MSGVFTLQRAALFLTGVAAGATVNIFKTTDDREIAALRKSVADLERRVANQQASHENGLEQPEAKVERRDQRLNDVPSTTQIVAAMEALLSNTMASVDARLSAQAYSMEVLKTTVSQTDELLERLLESLDSLRSGQTDGESEFTGVDTSTG